MKKIVWFLLGISMVFTGCSKEKKDINNIDEVNSVNEKIIEYFQNSKDYENFIFNYVDEESGLVIVGLKDNSKEEQDFFKQEVVNSDLIKFVKGEPLTDLSDKSKIDYDGKSCEYIRTYHFVDYYDYEATVPSNFFIVVDAYQENSPIILELNSSFKDINFIKGENYEFTFRDTYGSLKTIDGNTITKSTQLLKVEHTEKIGMDQTQDGCILK